MVHVLNWAAIALALTVSFVTSTRISGAFSQISLEYLADSFTPFGDLHMLSSEEFTTLHHPEFPRHSVRVKQSHFCDESVKVYTGYIDIEARHLFFYFFESRGNPGTDPAVFWTNGGPGSSSSWGLFMELGPCRVTSPNNTARFTYSWNEHANIFFIDQPVGVGFSYADYGESVSSTFEAGDDIAAFMAVFFEHFTQFKNRPVHMTGQSYAGRYLPVFASKIYDQNTQLRAAGMTPINLSSVMIGNGCTDFTAMLPAYYYAQCEDPIMAPIASTAECVQMKQKLPRCERLLKESCVDHFDIIDCEAADEFCGAAFFGFIDGKNWYDRTRPCKGHSSSEECYPISVEIERYLSSNDTQTLLGVDPQAGGNFAAFSPPVNAAFSARLDSLSFPAQHYLAALLERGIPVLLYAGDTDFACNYIGIEKMALALEWSKGGEFRQFVPRPWIISGEEAGVTRSGGGLTFATVSGAGHLVPYDRPEEAFILSKRWFNKEDL